jgi:uncharacterized protein (DUF1800 family)
MIRRTALAIVLGAAACTPPDGPTDDPSALPTGQTQQAAESLAIPAEQDAIRFLEQATFGPKLATGTGTAAPDTVQHVVAVGIPQAITEQFNAPRSTFDGTTTSKDLGSQFFSHAMTGEDQLRQRVAFALSQLLVISQTGIPENPNTPESEPKLAMAGYLNLLSANAFINFRELMEAVTLNPAMGTYLDMANNRAFDTAGRPIEPNENFARELLQLFTLGLHKLNEDGTQRLDADGVPIPAYTEAHVQAFSRALSGWTYASATGCPGLGRRNIPSYTGPLIGCDANHDSSSQTLLRGVVTVEGGTAREHLEHALNNIFYDPNLPPFVCKQLIQHLVTSNPSPAYVQRVVAVFKNNGAGVRGDMRAVVRKILEDTEARGAMPPSTLTATFGHLRPPALFITSMLRWLNTRLDTTDGKDPGAKINAWSRAMGQYVPRPPSVFSYYPPHAPAPGGNGLLGPEFAILDTATVTARANFVHELLFATSPATAGVLIDLGVVPSIPNDMLVWLDRYWLHDTMSSNLQLVLSNALNDTRSGVTSQKQKLALYLTALSPEFQIQR